MANPRFNKQVAQPRAAHKVGGRVKKMGGGMSTRRRDMHRVTIQMIWV